MTTYIRYDKKNDELYLREFNDGQKFDAPYIQTTYTTYENEITPIVQGACFHKVFCVDVARHERLYIGYFPDNQELFFTCEQEESTLSFLFKDDWIRQAVIALGMEKVPDKRERLSEYIEEHDEYVREKRSVELREEFRTMWCAGKHPVHIPDISRLIEQYISV